MWNLNTFHTLLFTLVQFVIKLLEVIMHFCGIRDHINRITIM